MRRTIVMAILAFGGVVNGQAPFFARNAMNGLGWRSLTPAEKTLYLTGAIEAFYEAYQLQMSHASLECVESLKIASATWFKGTLTDLRREIEAFYEDPNNIAVPIMNALAYSRLKLSGASKLQLEDYRAAALHSVANE
jgi:hypothetical protein